MGIVACLIIFFAILFDFSKKNKGKQQKKKGEKVSTWKVKRLNNKINALKNEVQQLQENEAHFKKQAEHFEELYEGYAVLNQMNEFYQTRNEKREQQLKELFKQSLELFVSQEYKKVQFLVLYLEAFSEMEYAVYFIENGQIKKMYITSNSLIFDDVRECKTSNELALLDQRVLEAKKQIEIPN